MKRKPVACVSNRHRPVSVTRVGVVSPPRTGHGHRVGSGFRRNARRAAISLLSAPWLAGPRRGCDTIMPASAFDGEPWTWYDSICGIEFGIDIFFIDFDFIYFIDFDYIIQI